ncbi:endonuclease V [Halocatena pleomorpha]|uniref:Endonuclease V n=1 Tax=Halocatena pleomorpha TaxID=1785090 RepID=A0A3P3R638_9EURY|nr:endonuclease V [Halocatena pleomorpha]RRJ28917.1 endonuclease V [Halocatena pleomorpha]
MAEIRERFRPDPSMNRTQMEALQRDIAQTAVFEDAVDFDPTTVTVDTPTPETPIVAGVDQAFLDDQIVSAIVLTRGETVVARTHTTTPIEFPYVPGLLSFREGGPILDAFEALPTDPDVIVFDGSGRIHFREAGLATHIGVALDLPAIGVAKTLLCGQPVSSTAALAAGERVEIVADETMSTPDGTTVGHALQTRQYPNSHRINPVYVSPGHRLSADTATAIIDRCRGAYKLPEPTRLADAAADEAKDTIE